MKKRIIYCILFLLLLADLCYSFAQHLSQPLDGDMAWNIVPANEVKTIIENPFGIDVILKNQSYPNPNRFFSHYFMKKYFEATPLFLQKFVNPIDSVYLSCAVEKILIQIFLIILLSFIISGTLNFLKSDFLISAILVTPFFQTEGYQGYMGIIDLSPSYTFFYAWPLAILLLYISPFILMYYHGNKPASQLLIYIVWIPLALVISLSGPLNPGIVLIISLLLFFSNIQKNYIQSNQPNLYGKIKAAVYAIPKQYWFYLLPISIFSIYSLYIGQYNSNNEKIPLIDLYLRLPIGIYNPLTKKLGFPFLLLCIAFNYFIIRNNYKTTEGRKILNILKWIGIFALIYILLLPLGGYRDYRVNVLRYDTIMPITISLIFVFSISTLFLYKNLKLRRKNYYIIIICGVLLFFTINDEQHFDKNMCERMELKEIADAKSSVVPLHNNCTVLSWHKITKPEDSELNAQLLTLWKVTKKKTLYYNK
jgi:hypothetical protein